ncbi:hypothetical protein [Buttiauxella sp. S19-1]|uniref:hypothetical protein n=1 Tax=Buttiauxella sp. S19-1 TaxID=941430 RepID=UPI001EDAC2A1|nr:hypothetical protein [Buttiauxella sp. S19-1]
MRERGMIFNAEMVRAILNGSKTQTRRVFKKQPDEDGVSCLEGRWFDSSETRHDNPFGKVGDHIWVRETFTPFPGQGDGAKYLYRADADDDGSVPYLVSNAGGFGGGVGNSTPERWVPSIHMPRTASRILLEIIGVRLEQLIDISEEDAQAEGVTPSQNSLTPPEALYRVGFANLWRDFYGEENWDSKPWVWVIEFKRVEVSND